MEDEGTVAKKVQGKRKSIEKAAKAHAAANEIRLNQIKANRAAYAQIKDSVALADILHTGQRYIDLNLKLAQDGVGARETGHKLTDGTNEVENYFFSKDERLAKLDNAAGIQQLLDYIERQLNPLKPTPTAKPKPVHTA